MSVKNNQKKTPLSIAISNQNILAVKAMLQFMQYVDYKRNYQQLTA